MRRRELIAAAAASTIVLPFTARAAQPSTRVIGWLNSTSGDEQPRSLASFRQGLREKGWVEGQNVVIEYRWAESHYDRLPALARDLVDRQVDVIVTGGGTPAAYAAKTATSTIPVVFVGVAYPVEGGLVASLARPGGNLTGFSIFGGELTPKRLQLLHELVPAVARIAMLVDPSLRHGAKYFADAVNSAAAEMGLQLIVLETRTPDEFEPAFAKLGQLGAGALLVDAGPLFYSRREQLVALARQYAVPASYFEPEFAELGGLISNGPRITTLWREAAGYVAKILNGTNPADLPVQQPTEFEIVINVKTAKALGLTVPPALLARADEVIE